MIHFNTRHGATAGRGKTKLYQAWCSMKERCSNPNVRAFADYGARGITVCERWAESFEAFAEDVGEAPSASHTVGRIENDGNYEPGNVRWENRFQQSGNRRSCVWLTFESRTEHIREWSRITGIPKSTLHNRIRFGWTEEEILTTPPYGIRHKNHA